MTNSPDNSDNAGNPSPVALSAEQAVVLFDGVCNFCNGVVRWIFERDPAGRFRFAPLQGAWAQARLDQLGRRVSLDTIVLIEGDRVFERSDAVLRIARGLRAPWPLCGLLLWVPRLLRDPFYRMVAKVRYRIWGRRETCGIPPKGLRERFLDFG